MRLLKLTSPMMYGDDVRELQTKLNQLGYNCGAADGYFGNNTDSAVRRFQSAKGLDVDGIVGPNTWGAINSAISGGQTGGSGSLSKFVSVAAGEIGYHETGDNNTKYGAWYGMNGQPWCAMFVSWCANQAGILNSVVPKYASCALGYEAYNNKGKYRTRGTGYVPKAGDVIIFYNTKYSAPFYHTGIVESVSSGNVNTIEGNSSDAVRRRSYSLSYGDIHGYGVN